MQFILQSYSNQEYGIGIKTNVQINGIEEESEK